jgi:hypothetical protein
MWDGRGYPVLFAPNQDGAGKSPGTINPGKVTRGGRGGEEPDAPAQAVASSAQTTSVGLMRQEAHRWVV